MITIILLLFILSGFLLFIEYRIHLHNLNSIPIRIHVNGTRGKSSVTRLIAGALREHGIRTFAKTTGTLPRMIMHDGNEYPIYRPSRPNIIEQLRIVSMAAHNGAEALVIECMAVQPLLQSISELKMIRATHGVITNTRADHLDVMGPLERNVVEALLGTTPQKGYLFTAEADYVDEFRDVCKDRQSELCLVDRNEIEKVADQDMAGFSYVEHKENVALALKVSASFGVRRDVALRGMWKAIPDPGAMSEHELDFFGRKILFINGFAANDPESSERIWQMALERHPQSERKIMIINSRPDRPDRSKQLGEAVPGWIPADHYILMGGGIYVFFRTIVANGLDSSKIVYAEGMAVDRIFEEVMRLSGRSALVMGIGNIGGQGLELANYFRNRTAIE